MSTDPTSTQPQAALNIVLIGAGRMGQALLSGIQSQSSQHNITAIEPHQPTRERVADELGIHTLASISELSDEDNNVDVIMLAVKPQMMRDVLADLQPLLSGNELVISVAAGTSMNQLAQACAHDQAIIRAMPNTPALIGMGITALTAGESANAEHIRLAENLLAGCGEVVVLEEEAQLAAVTAISGSGPAYFFALEHALLEAAGQLGLPEAVADKLVRATGRGACELAWQSHQTPWQLQENVRSPGGTTAAALAVFEQREFMSLIVAATRAATDRALELAGDNADNSQPSD